MEVALGNLLPNDFMALITDEFPNQRIPKTTMTNTSKTKVINLRKLSIGWSGKMNRNAHSLNAMADKKSRMATVRDKLTTLR
jgi:hypothetical protein